MIWVFTYFDDWATSMSFASPFRGWDIFPAMQEGWFNPYVDMRENDKQITIRAELAGCKKEDIRLDICDGYLELSGKKMQNKEDRNEDNLVRRERRFGEFYRRMPIPREVKPENVKAMFKDGVLNVTIEKTTKTERPTGRVNIAAE